MSAAFSEEPRADQTFLGLRRLGEKRWILPIDVPICAGTGRLFGGAGSAALAAALEIESGQQLKAMHTQFLRSASPGDELVGVVSEIRRGHTSHFEMTFSNGSVAILRCTGIFGTD